MLHTEVKCPMCRANVSNDVIEKAIFNNELTEKINNANQDTIRWFYSGRNEGYWQFDDISIKLLEEAYQKWQASNKKINTGFKASTYKDENELIENGFIPIAIGGVNILYFNFSQMCQFNHRNLGTRKIIRTDKSSDTSFMIKGIAGLKL
jgi:hypothetical protein